MKVTLSKELTKCELCGVVIGNYYKGKKYVSVTYQYPICVKYNGHLYAVDMRCFDNLESGKRKPDFNKWQDAWLAKVEEYYTTGLQGYKQLLS